MVTAVLVVFMIFFIMFSVIRNHVHHGHTVRIGHIVDHGMLRRIIFESKCHTAQHPLIAL